MTTQIPEAVIRQLPEKRQLHGGFDIEYKLKYSGTVQTDKRTMSFVDNLWGIEVTGGADQFEPLTIIAVRRVGLARRAGIRVGDYIVKINDTPAEGLTLLDAQLEIQESGRHLKLFVKGDEDNDSEDENVCDFYFKPLSSRDLDLLEWERRRKKKRELNMLLYQGFPWNDRRRPIYKESNCYLVPSIVLVKREREICMKATKEEYMKNLHELAAQKEEQERLKKMEEEESSEEFEALARESTQQHEESLQEEFSEIIKTTSSAE
ncbi:unnamed protein product [Chironomus riparius]|uniref:PDZ domain-containing protein n=1 Tax=Chironomus riparius TaxID=315576 RepID=A0A9N9RP67_9DIPT|nr:unnamed protein product [Chironomus riparius]